MKTSLLLIRAGLPAVIFACLMASIASAQNNLSDKVSSMLEKNCSACHQDSDDGGIDYIGDLEELVTRNKIAPGDLESSRIWDRINDPDDPMPPEGETPRPTPQEIADLKQYILGLKASAEQPVEPAPATTKSTDQAKPPESPRDQTISQAMVIQSIHEYLSETDMEDRRYKRFFTLHHLYNLPTKKENPRRGINNSYLDLVRAATSKTLNSLTWSPAILVPEVLGPEKTVMVFDLRDIEWDKNRNMGRPDLWKILVQEYPYGVKHELYPDNLSTQSKSKEIYQWTGADIPWVKADWFIATGTQPQIYHALLYDAVHDTLRRRPSVKVTHADGIERIEQPMNASDLYGWLKVDVAGNLRRGRAARAAFTRSGVSSQNRMIERHPALYGYVWPSYDFKRGGERTNLSAMPLGPDGTFKTEFSKYSFKHDGGEMIFGLPNGMQGFLLVDGNGDRIAFGPPDVVFDKTKTTGNGMIVNGLSCIACHKNGLIKDFKDEIRFGAQGFPAQTRRVVRKLFLDRPELDVLIDKDQLRYRTAAIEAIGPFLPREKVKAMKAGGRLVEPIDPIATRFLGSTIDSAVMATELGITEEELKAAIKYNQALQDLGLMVVANGGTFNRETWQSGKGLSVYQKVMQIIKLGTPTSVQAPPWRGR